MLWNVPNDLKKDCLDRCKKLPLLLSLSLGCVRSPSEAAGLLG